MFRPWNFRTLHAGVLVVFVLAAVTVGISVRMDRADSIDLGIKDADNVAVVLGSQIERTIHSMDEILRGLQERIDRLDSWTPNGPLRIPNPAGFHVTLRQQLSLMPHAFHIGVTDAEGNLIMSSASWPPPDLFIGDRDYFVDLANHDDNRLSIGVPIASRLTGERTIVLSRRINGPDRTFLGIVFISSKEAYFAGAYSAIEVLPGRFFSLVRADGTVLTRYPDTGDRAGVKLPAWSPWYATTAAGGGSYRSPGAFDTVTRWVAVRALSGQPLFVSIAVEENIILEKWWSRALLMVFGTSVLMTCVGLLLWGMTRQYQGLSLSQAALAEKSDALAQNHAHLVESQAALALQNQRFDAALNNMGHGLAMFDASGRLVVCNHSYRRMYNLSEAEARPGTALGDILVTTGLASADKAEAAVREIIERLSNRDTCDHEFVHPSGRVHFVNNSPMKDGGWLSTHEDVTDQRKNERRIRRLAQNDHLTGIANRSSFVEQLADARQRQNADNRPYTVLMLDLDRFKDVNDSLGHAVGDALLKEISQRLQSSLRSTDVVARLGGDEFAIIQGPGREALGVLDEAAVMRESAIVLANRIVDLIAQPYDIDGRKVVVGVSIGIALAPADGVDPDELMKKADLALYRIKADGRNGYAFFDAEMSKAADERHRLEVDLRAGLARGEFELHYQPIADIASSRICCMEALVRWRHPTLGLVTPDTFISLAEDTGLITALGEWIIQKACADAAGWPAHVKVAVNVSPVQLRKTNLFDVILCAMVDSGLPPERLEIEITEQVLLQREGDHLSTLYQLQNLGISIALDDFGTGYSSLSYLKTFPFQKIKIDRSFTSELLERSDCAAIVCAVIGMGRALDIVTVAEGVETAAQFQALRAAGLNQVQGWLIGRPGPVDTLQFDDVVVECERRIA